MFNGFLIDTHAQHEIYFSALIPFDPFGKAELLR